MSDTFSFASHLCRFVVLLIILLIGGANLYLWQLGRPYQDVISTFVPLLMPILVLMLAFDTFRALTRTRRQVSAGQLCIPVVLPCQFWQVASLRRQALELGGVSGFVLFPWRSRACLIPRFIQVYPWLPQG